MYHRHNLTLSKLSGAHGDLGDWYQIRATVPRRVQCVRHDEEGARSGTEHRQLLVRTPRHSQESTFDTTYTLHLCEGSHCVLQQVTFKREREITKIDHPHMNFHHNSSNVYTNSYLLILESCQSLMHEFPSMKILIAQLKHSPVLTRIYLQA